MGKPVADRLLPRGAEYPVWSPYEAHDAATALMLYLREQVVSEPASSIKVEPARQ